MKRTPMGIVVLWALVLLAWGARRAATQDEMGWLNGAPVLRPQVDLSDLHVLGSSARTWSPDGRFVLFAEWVGERTRLTLLTVDTPQRTTRLATKDTISTMQWSPDGKWIAYAAGRPGVAVYDLLLLPMPQGEPKVIATGLLPASQLEWSPDSKRLAIALSRTETTHEVRVWEIATGRELARLAEATLWAMGPKWSPDGTRLAVSDASGATMVARIGEGPNVPAPEGWRGLAPSPDVRYVVGWLGTEAGVLDTLSGRAAPIVLREGMVADLPDSVVDRGPVWFGESTAFALSQEGRLWVVTAATGRGRPVGPRQATGSPRLEQTGPHGAVAYHQATGTPTRSGFYLLEGPKAEPRRLLGPETGPYHGWRWSPDGRWGDYTFRTPLDWRDAAAGYMLWWALLNTKTGKLYRLDTEGMIPGRPWPLFWSPVRAQAIAWCERGPRLLTLPK